MEKFSDLEKLGIVLILVLMEDALRVDKRIIIIEPDGVLILVLMEDTLRASFFNKSAVEVNES